MTYRSDDPLVITMHARKPARSSHVLRDALAIAAGCGGSGRRTLIPGPETVAASPDANQPYVVRMSDGVRDWEVEFPSRRRGTRSAFRSAEARPPRASRICPRR